MRPLWPRIDDVMESEGALVIDRAGLNSELSGAFLDWLGDRVLKDDVLTALSYELPEAPPEQLLMIAATVAQAVGQP